jgi:plasmid maintenance system antidote protein VapI
MMLTTKRKPATVSEILVEEFMEPMRLTQGVLAKQWGCRASTSMNYATIAVP